jgi:hypothetical protein
MKPLVVTKLPPALRINPHNVPAFQMKAQDPANIAPSKIYL